MKFLKQLVQKAESCYLNTIHHTLIQSVVRQLTHVAMTTVNTTKGQRETGARHVPTLCLYL